MPDRGGRSLGAGTAGVGLVAVTLWLAAPGRDAPPAVLTAVTAPARDSARPAPRGEVRPYDAGTRLVAGFLGAPVPTDSDSARALAQWPLRGRLPARAGTPGTAPPGESPPPPVDFDAIVATIPDPFDSHLDYAYDAQLEAILLALGDAGYVLDRFWLPQRGDSLRDGPAADAPRVPAHERYPGAILFRRVGWDTASDSVRAARASGPADTLRADTLALRLVYLVPEMPTGGVHKEALRAALGERKALRRRLRGDTARDTIAVVGPNFSGAALSLVEVLAAWARDSGRVGAADTVLPHVSVTSGRATSLDTLLVGAAAARGVFIKTMVHPDVLLDAALRCVVLPALDLRREQVLFLIESSTAYGASTEQLGEARRRPCGPGDSLSAARDTTRYRIARFPLAVASLRAEYARHPDAAPGASATSALPGTRSAPRLPIPLADPSHPRERPPTISPLTPPALDLRLAGIVRMIRDQKIRAVGLLASDVRDKLFLADELRKRVRDVQLFTFESELLYARPDYADPLRGMLVFSTYPLVPAAQLWSRGPSDWAIAQSEGALGIYNATLVALGETKRIREYGEPSGFRRKLTFWPPVWLTVVGRGTIAPLTVFAEDSAGWPRPGQAGFPRAEPPPARYDAGVLAVAVVGAAVAVLALVAWGLGVRVVGHLASARDAGGVHAMRDRTTFAVAATPLPIAAVRVERALRPAAERRAWWSRIDRAFRRRRRRGEFARASRWSAWTQACEFERVETASLVTHQWLYRGLLLVAYLAFATPAAALLIGAWNGGWPVALGVAVLLGWLAAIACLATAFGTLRRYFGLGRVFAWPLPNRAPGRTALWNLEFFTRALVAVLGVGYAGVVAWLAVRIVALRADRPEVFALLFYRAFHLETGVSPLIPLALAGAGFASWCAWHSLRIELLHETTPFEAVCRRYAVRAGAASSGGAREGGPAAAAAGVARAVDGIRTRLFLLVPDRWGVTLLAALVAVAAWFTTTFARTVESTVFLAGASVPGPFEWLLRFGVVALLAATAWGVYRLLTVWEKLRECLDELSELPLLTAFERLPPRISRLTRLSLVSPRWDHAIDAVTAQQRGHLAQIAAHSGEEMRLAFGEAAAVEAERFAEGGAAPVAWRDEVTRLERLAFVLGTVWQMQPTETDIEAVEKELGRLTEQAAKSGEPVTVSTGSLVRRTFTGPAGIWLREAEEYAAVRVVEYAEWVLRHLRRLAGFLLVALLITTAMLSSYPFQPQSRAKLGLVAVLVAAVAALLLVMSQMNRNEVLSRITKTDPGRITWSTGFVVNLLLFVLVPLLALVSSEFPEARSLLFGWVEPVLRAVARS